MEKQNNIELIEAFYEGRLSPEEKVEFELRLVYDPQLSEELQIYKKFRSGFNVIKADQLRKRLRNLDDELDNRRSGGDNRKLFYLLAGLAACLAIVFFSYYQFQKSSSFHAEMIPAEAGLPVLMGSKSHLDFNNAMTSFKAGEYAIASVGFSKALLDFPDNDTCLFFLGASLLNEGKHTEAVTVLSQLQLQGTSVYCRKGRYYLALALWADENRKEAYSLFEEISKTDGHPFRNESVSMIDKLGPM